MESLYYDALMACLMRYRAMIDQDPHREKYSGHNDLLDFISEFEVSIKSRYPLNKLNRWIGYIQGVLIERGVTTVNAEREWTRPLFRQLDFAPKPNPEEKDEFLHFVIFIASLMFVALVFSVT